MNFRDPVPCQKTCINGQYPKHRCFMGPTNQMMGYCYVTLPEQGRIQGHATSVLIDNIFLSLTLAFLPTMVNHVQHEQLCTTRSTSTTHTSIVAIPSHSVFLMPDLWPANGDIKKKSLPQGPQPNTLFALFVLIDTPEHFTHWPNSMGPDLQLLLTNARLGWHFHCSTTQEQHNASLRSTLYCYHTTHTTTHTTTNIPFNP